MLTLLIQTVSAQSVDNPKITYFHNDITGTPIAASDEEGNIIWREERRAYGKIKVDPLKPKTLEEFSVGFTGHQADRESGLIYAKARYYNPNIGRFYAPDPIPFRQNDLVSFNRYAYAGNNPYKYFDPTGKVVETAWDVANVGMGLYSFGSNLWEGNFGSALLDLGGVVVDSTATIVPFVPGGAGTAIKAKRVASSAIDASQTTQIAMKHTDDVAKKVLNGRVKPVNSRLPTNGKKYAGRTIPLEDLPKNIRNKYPNSVPFSGAGFPDFSRYSIKNVRITLGKNRSTDFRRADKAAGYNKSNPRPAGYTWHHHQDSGYMQLVPTDLHQAIRHTGGIATAK